MNPLLAITFTCTLLSMAGVPPLAGFCAKMYVFFSAMEGGMYLVAFIGVMCSVVGAFYYLRFIKIMYFEKLTNWVSFNQVSREAIYYFRNFFLIHYWFIFKPNFIVNFNT